VERGLLNLGFRNPVILLFAAVCIQLILGIITVLYSVGEVPVFWGVLHQAGALLVILSAVNLFFYTKTQEQ
jgi:heme A synthase